MRDDVNSYEARLDGSACSVEMLTVVLLHRNSYQSEGCSMYESTDSRPMPINNERDKVRCTPPR